MDLMKPVLSSHLPNEAKVFGLGLFILLCAAILLAAPPSPPLKSVNILVLYAGLSPSMQDRIEVEKVAAEKIAPMLKKKGFRVENAFSFTQISADNGGAHRALVNAFAKEPSRDTAHTLMVTFDFKEGAKPDSIKVDLALMDFFVSNLIQARKNNSAPNKNTLWTYTAPPQTDGFEKTPETLDKMLEIAITEYNSRYDHMIVSNLSSHPKI